MLNASR
jgi:hypothetical protein